MSERGTERERERERACVCEGERKRERERGERERRMEEVGACSMGDACSSSSSSRTPITWTIVGVLLPQAVRY